MYMMIDVGLELLVEDQPIYIIVVFAASDWTRVSVKRHVHTETKPQDTSRKPPTMLFFQMKKGSELKNNFNLKWKWYLNNIIIAFTCYILIRMTTKSKSLLNGFELLNDQSIFHSCL